MKPLYNKYAQKTDQNCTPTNLEQAKKYMHDMKEHVK